MEYRKRNNLDMHFELHISMSLSGLNLAEKEKQQQWFRGCSYSGIKSLKRLRKSPVKTEQSQRTPAFIDILLFLQNLT